MVDARPKGETYYTVSASVMAEGTLQQLRDFVYDFQQSGLLHRVKSMTLVSTRHQGDPVLKATIAVEGLALVRGSVGRVASGRSMR